MDPILRCNGLTRHFGSRLAVDELGFRIAPGETYGLLGPNGSGKTTTISMVAGILRPDRGEVVVAGHPVTTEPRSAKAALGLVPQEIALYDDLSAEENLRFFGRLQRLGRRRLDRRIAEVLEIVGLADRSRDRVADYSGGMKRRLNIGVGLLHEPRLLILDEPTVGVDPQSRNQILASVERLGGEGLSVLYTTHYMEEAERLCDRVGIIDDGRLIAEGSRAELVAQVGEHSIVSIRLDAGDASGAGGRATTFAERCSTLAGVVDARAHEDEVRVRVDEPGRRLAQLVLAAGEVGAGISAVSVDEPDLEMVFLHLTGRALRD